MLFTIEIELDNAPGKGCWVLIKHGRKTMMRFYCWAHALPRRRELEQDADYVWRVIAEAELLRFDSNGKSLHVRQH